MEFVPRPATGWTVHIIWMTTGLGCDGDSVAMTSATNLRLEDLIEGVVPGTPQWFARSASRAIRPAAA